MTTSTIMVLHAGSLAGLLAEGIGPSFFKETGIVVKSESGHSVALANRIKDGTATGDVYLSADAATNLALIGPNNGNLIRWFLVFARNSVVLAYSPKSRHVDDFQRAGSGHGNWYDILIQPAVKIARVDPNLDPMAYYTLLVCALAEDFYQIPNLKQQILGGDMNPAQLGRFSIAMLNSGEIDAMFLYLTAAISLGLPYITLPNEINLSDPSREARYSGASFTNNRGQTFRGAAIRFSAAPIENSANPDGAESFIAFLSSPAGQLIVQQHHFLASPILIGGDPSAVPPSIQPAIQGTFRQGLEPPPSSQ